MGPLAGIRVIELGGIGPCPFCAMLLADMGADVVRVERLGSAGSDGGRPFEITGRGKRPIALDLKQPEAVGLMLDLVAAADAMMEGFRPGVAERLGLGPDVCLARNPRLVYGRMTGWGQTGPLAQAPGHDLNYIALAGVLDAIGPREGPPVPPLNLVGDYGGGALYLALGLLAGLLHARATGQGQVVDAAMVDGAASLMSLFLDLRRQGAWTARRQDNMLDGGAPYYRAYECADGRFVTVAAIEPKFYATLLEKLGAPARFAAEQDDRASWPEQHRHLAAIFRTRTREQWTALLEKSETCFAPVLALDEAPSHPHLAARGSFVVMDEIVQPAPAPRFGGTPCALRPLAPPQRSVEILASWGIDRERAEGLVRRGLVG